MRSTDRSLKKLIDTVHENEQEHIFNYWDQLSKAQKGQLISQIRPIDFNLLDQLYSNWKNNAGHERYPQLNPANMISLSQREKEDKDTLPIGTEALQKGQVAAFLVAGGQGSRLGFDGPKGMYRVTPVIKKSLFQLHAEKIFAMARRYETVIPWYIMTSETNHGQTKSYFIENGYFGLQSDNVYFFNQEMMPALNKQGKLILTSNHQIFCSPNGHGGSIKALWDSGAIDDMQKRGIKYIFYFQVDNVLAQICDPAFLGYHIRYNSEMSNKVVRKVSPEEKMGIICELDGRTGVIEYSDLSEQDMYARESDGSLRYWAGNIATHIINVDFIIRENKDGFKLPYHFAEKEIPFIDASGKLLKPGHKNGLKFETFVFDAIADVKNTISIEVDRSKEFSALKNMEGFNSPKTVRSDLLRTYAAWLGEAGFDIKVDGDKVPDIELEISPLFALNAADVKARRHEIHNVYNGLYLK